MRVKGRVFPQKKGPADYAGLSVVLLSKPPGIIIAEDLVSHHGAIGLARRIGFAIDLRSEDGWITCEIEHDEPFRSGRR